MINSGIALFSHSDSAVGGFALGNKGHIRFPWLSLSFSQLGDRLINLGPFTGLGQLK